MAHTEQFNFVERTKSRFPTFFNNTKVLEVGSLNLNGTIRIFFDNCDYTGIDLGPGPCVDIVSNGKDFRSTDLFDVTVSAECFEHNPDWIETFQNMVNLTKSGGIVMFTCAGIGRAEHGTARCDPRASPFNNHESYYRNLTTKDFVNNWNFEEIFVEYGFEYSGKSFDLYFFGIKR